MATGTKFTRLVYICNLQICQMSQGVCPRQTLPAQCNVTLQLKQYDITLQPVGTKFFTVSKSFIKLASVVDLIIFCVYLLTLFCKSDRFINADNNCLSAVKRSSLLTKVSKFTPKKFYEIDSCCLLYKHITIVNDDSSGISK